jgi:hypothetical protein
MPDSVPYVLPQHRFPNRLHNVRRTGIEIALSEGVFGRILGRGAMIEARLNDFRILYFTPFNHPTNWNCVDWANEHVRLSLYGLRISSNRGSCLSLYWKGSVLCPDHEPKRPELEVVWFPDPSEDDWDRQLRSEWESRKRRRAELEARFKELPTTVHPRRKRPS